MIPRGNLLGLKVFNADGRMVMDATNDTRGVDGDWILDATSWTPGMYIVHVTQLGTTCQLPWIKVAEVFEQIRTKKGCLSRQPFFHDIDS